MKRADPCARDTRSPFSPEAVRSLVSSTREFLKTETRAPEITADSPGIMLARARDGAARIRRLTQRTS